MRVWILEDTPDYEQTTRHGIFSSPVVAWDELFNLVNKSVFEGTNDAPIKIYVGADARADINDPTRPVVLVVEYARGDQIILSGEAVKGTNASAPTLSEWRDLQQVAGLLRSHAVQVAGYESADETPNRLATGWWSFRKTDVPF